MSETFFRRFVSNFYGVVADCFVIHSPKLDDNFEPFEEENNFDAIHESDDDENHKSNLVGRQFRLSYEKEFVRGEKLLSSCEDGIDEVDVIGHINNELDEFLLIRS